MIITNFSLNCEKFLDYIVIMIWLGCQNLIFGSAMEVNSGLKGASKKVSNTEIIIKNLKNI